MRPIKGKPFHDPHVFCTEANELTRFLGDIAIPGKSFETVLA
jgi:hypothetical protein